MVTVAGVNDMQLITKPLLAELARKPVWHMSFLHRCVSTLRFEAPSQCDPCPITRLGGAARRVSRAATSAVPRPRHIRPVGRRGARARGLPPARRGR